MVDPEDCPGLYCGRVNLSDNGGACYSECMVNAMCNNKACNHGVGDNLLNYRHMLSSLFAGLSCPNPTPCLFKYYMLAYVLLVMQECPRGYRTSNMSSECLPCSDQGSLRDYMFLGFFCLLCITIHLSIISLANNGRRAGPAKL